MASRYRAQSSNLTSGLNTRSYGAVSPNSDRPPSYSPLPAAPDPTSTPGLAPNPTYGPFQGRTPIVISRGLAFCFAIILAQTVLIICRSDALGRLIDLDSATLRESRERSALVAERAELEQQREKSEQEREKMRRERELWEKTKEDRVPQGAFWDVVRPAPACHAYGKREYWATIQNVPEGWTATDACMNMPVEIKGVAIRRPYRCESVDGSPHVRGYWMVDWDQPDCRPWWRNYQDAGCTSYKSGARRIEGEFVGLIGRPEQDWWLMCASTPLIWNYITYTSPTHCEERDGMKFGMWDVSDDSCRLCARFLPYQKRSNVLGKFLIDRLFLTDVTSSPGALVALVSTFVLA